MEHFDITGHRIFAPEIFWSSSQRRLSVADDPFERLRELSPSIGFHELPIEDTLLPVLCIKRPDGSNVLTITRLDA